MIEHKGTVLSVTEREMIVEIEARTACGDCKAKAFCSMSDQKEKQIVLPVDQAYECTIGEEVIVTLRSSLGLKAVFLMYLLPLVFLLIVLFTFPLLHVSELVTGIAALLAPLFCYFIVWIFRERIEKDYIFVLKS